MDSDVALRFLVTNSQRWIATQRDKYRPVGESITRAERARLNSHFGSATLDAARVVRVPAIENPDFYAHLDQMPLDLRAMSGITYGDTILVSESQVPGPTPISLLFHEVVHVVQYAILGLDEFAKQYVMGWAQNGFDYFRIPLEAQAYCLQEQFERGQLRDRVVEPLIRLQLEQ